MKLADLDEYVDHFRHRVMQDALAEATATYWRGRAEAFNAALPREGDFTGRATPDQIEAQRYRVAASILACSTRAAVSLGGETPDHVMCQTCGTPTSPWTCSCGDTRIGGDAA